MLNKEVMRPRSYRLEYVAIIAALASLVACVSDIETGQRYECRAKLSCNEGTWPFEAKICTSNPDPELVFEEEGLEWLDDNGVMCTDRMLLGIECSRLDELCATM